MVVRYDMDYDGWYTTEDGMFVMHEDYVELEKLFVLLKAAHDSLVSLLGSVQNDSIAATREANNLRKRFLHLASILQENIKEAPGPHILHLADGSKHTGPAVDFIHNLLNFIVDFCKEVVPPTILQDEWQPIETAPKTPQEILETTGDLDYRIIIGRKAIMGEDGIIAGCVVEAEWIEDGWYALVDPSMRHIFGDYTKIPNPTHWRPRCKVPS